jgi:RHS repeat-associated protein
MVQNYSTFSARPERFSNVKKGLYSSPFGCELKGRNLKKTGVNKSFRYGYQGSEADDEIKGDGNSYTTEFRQLDPRLGRWLSIDPVTHPHQSPYCSMDNNPIWFSDVFGNTIDPSSSKEFSEMKTQIRDEITKKTEAFDKLGSKIDSQIANGLEPSQESMNQLRYLSTAVNELETSLKELDLMESDQVWTFSFNTRSAAGGKTKTDPVNKTVKMEYGSMASGVHEAAHGFDAISGNLNGLDYTEDIHDEVKGHRRGVAFNQNHYASESIKYFFQVTPGWVRSRDAVYSNLAPNSLSVDTDAEFAILTSDVVYNTVLSGDVKNKRISREELARIHSNQTLGELYNYK